VEDPSSQENGPAPRWERRFPGRFQAELDAFKAENVVAVTDSVALQDGRLVIDFQWPHEGSLLPLRAVYPDSYPFLRPHVALRDPALFPDRHISPMDGTLCLLGRDSRQWTSSLTVPALLREQLADALKANANEDPQGEPAEFWWNWLALDDPSYCLVETSWDLWAKGIDSGRLTVRYTLEDGEGDTPWLRAAVTKAVAADGTVLAEWNKRLPPFLAGDKARELTIPWERLAAPPHPDHVTKAGSTLRNLMDESAIAASSSLFSPSALSKRRFRLNAFLYPSELEWKRHGDAWLFALVRGSQKGFQGRKALTGSVVRTLRAGPSDLASRAPQASALSAKKVCVIGTGAIGAPVAIELARNGIKQLKLLDFDIVEPGNSVRWPLGASGWGLSKLVALDAFIKGEYPNCDVSLVKHQLGTVSDKYPFGDERALTDVVEGVDLVIDASVAYWTTAFIHDFAAQRGLPVLALYASPPVTGGVVALYAPGSGCPACLEHTWEDGTVPKPPGMNDEGSLVQPPGCSERTFTGASYDLQEISLHAVRVAAAFLALGGSNGSTTVHTLSFEERDGVKIPSWRVDSLSRHPKCTCKT
jgi:hypothetical protein